MPYVNVKVAGPLTDAQKKEIAAGIAAVLQKAAGKEPKTTYTVFEEIPRNNWAVGANLLSEG